MRSTSLSVSDEEDDVPFGGDRLTLNGRAKVVSAQMAGRRNIGFIGDYATSRLYLYIHHFSHSNTKFANVFLRGQVLVISSRLIRGKLFVQDIERWWVETASFIS